MRLSFVICTRNRAQQLRRTLDSIVCACQNCTDHQFDLTLVDNGSTDNTARVFEEWASTAPLNAKRIYFAHPGLSASRNVGVSAAAADVVVFTDDDCVLTPTYCSELCHHLVSGPRRRIFGGRVELGDPTDLPLTIKVNREFERFSKPTHPGGFVLGCNMVIPRDVLDELGPFDERFGAGTRYMSAEDTDMLYRAFLKEIPIDYVPDMVVHHYHGRKTSTAIEKLNYAYHYGNGALYSKYLFIDPSFAKHLYWATRSAFRESWGGPLYEQDCNLSHWTIVKANLAGISRFALDRIKEFRHREDQQVRQKELSNYRR